MSERKLAYIVKIDEILAHTNADSLEIAVVGGWKVVVKLGEFYAGDYAMYHEIDSFLPASNAAYKFLADKGTTNYNGVEGVRLRSIKLRKQISQGLLIHPKVFGLTCAFEGEDYTEYLGIKKYEKPLASCLSGIAKGNFPSFLCKTDQERIQNIKREYQELLESGAYLHITEKIDGSSATYYYNNGEFGVCSRNLDLKYSEGNAFWIIAQKYNLEEKFKAHNQNIAIQGELIGYNIQGNAYGLGVNEFKFFVYDVYDIDNKTYLKHDSMVSIADSFGLDRVPYIDKVSLESIGNSIDDMLSYADGKSILNINANREGFVFVSADDPNVSFKVISNKWLLANNE